MLEQSTKIPSLFVVMKKWFQIIGYKYNRGQTIVFETGSLKQWSVP